MNTPIQDIQEQVRLLNAEEFAELQLWLVKHADSRKAIAYLQDKLNNAKEPEVKPKNSMWDFLPQRPHGFWQSPEDKC